jgi:mycoredoxin
MVAYMSSEQSALLPPAADSQVAASLTIYTTSWCPDCVAAKRFFDAKGVAYQEVDIESDPQAAHVVAGLNGGRHSVPTVVGGGAAASLSGFSITKAHAFLAAAGLGEL